MSIERYLLATAAALRNDVLPVLPPSPARDQVINCLRVLTRTAIGIEAAPQDARAVFENISLPQDIRDAFASTGDETISTIPPLAEEISVSASTVRGMSAASAWLMTEPWGDNPEQGQIARALLAWEAQQRSAKLARLAAAEEINQTRETETTKAAAIVSGANLSEATLLGYLQRKLNNSRLAIEGYRLLQGGRTRKTAMFKLMGQAASHADWPEWLVVQCDPPVGYHAFPGVVSQYPALEYVYQTRKIKAPRPLLMELDTAPFGTPFMIVARMPGSPPSAGINFFAPPPPSEKLALDIAEQIGILHSLPTQPLATSIPVMLPGENGWAGDLEALIATITERFHGPSLTMSAAFAWMRRNVHCVSDSTSLVHGDMLQQNLLTDGDTLTGILDWEAIRIGHPGEDLGYVRPMIEQMVAWDRFMEVYFASGGCRLSSAEMDFFTLRAYIYLLTLIAGSRNAFEEGRVDDIRAAEVGCSLAPQFVNCVATTLNKVLEREAKANGQ